MLVVDPHHWLADDGSLPTDNLRLRRQILRVVRLIESGAPLAPGTLRETLVECTRRPGRRPCLGLLRVVKTQDRCLYAFCPVCRQDEVWIGNWDTTRWAGGPAKPSRATGADLPPYVSG